MHKQLLSLSSLFGIILMTLIGCTLFRTASQQPPPQTRQTVITVNGTRALTRLSLPNLTSTNNGVVTIRPRILENPVYFSGYTSAAFRVANGAMQYRKPGADWADIGTGTGGTASVGGNTQAALTLSGTGAAASLTTPAASFAAPFFKTDWHSSAIFQLYTAQVVTLLELRNAAYSNVRLQIGIDAARKPYVKTGRHVCLGNYSSTTYTAARALGASEIKTSLRLDVGFSDSANTVVFCLNGECASALTANTVFDNCTTGNDTLTLGSALNGYLSFAAFGDQAVYPASTYLGLSNPEPYPRATWLANFSEGAGDVVQDRIGTLHLSRTDGQWITVGGFGKWVLGASGASCDTACVAAGMTCDQATTAWAGSDSPSILDGQSMTRSLRCESVLTALRAAPEGVGDGADDAPAEPAGCAIDMAGLSDWRWGHGSPTTCAATQTNYQRACACQ